SHINEMTYEAMADDIVNYCREKDLDKIILLGHSMGGKVAMHVAASNPDLVKKLIVVDISPKYYSPHHQQILDGLTALEEETFTSRGHAEDFLKEFIPDTGTRLFLLKNLYRKNKNKLALRLNLKVLKENIEEIGLAIPSGLRFNGPTLFLKGGKSNYINEKDKPLIELHFPEAKIKEIPGAGHWVHAEKAEEFYKEVIEFL